MSDSNTSILLSIGLFVFVSFIIPASVVAVGAYDITYVDGDEYGIIQENNDTQTISDTAKIVNTNDKTVATVNKTETQMREFLVAAEDGPIGSVAIAVEYNVTHDLINKHGAKTPFIVENRMIQAEQCASRVDSLTGQTDIESVLDNPQSVEQDIQAACEDENTTIRVVRIGSSTTGEDRF